MTDDTYREFERLEVAEYREAHCYTCGCYKTECCVTDDDVKKCIALDIETSLLDDYRKKHCSVCYGLNRDCESSTFQVRTCMNAVPGASRLCGCVVER